MSRKAVTVLVAIYQAGEFINAKLANLQEQSIFDDCWFVFLNCQNLHNERAHYQHWLQLPNVIEINYDKRVGLYSTWNDGIKTTDSEFICNSNVDDLWRPLYLEKCVAHLREVPECACVSAGIQITSIPNQTYYNKWRADMGRMPLLPYPQSSAGPCPVWRRSLHAKYGYFGDYYVIGDARIWEKWIEGGEQFDVIPEDLVLYFASSNSLERRICLDTGKLFRTLDLEQDEKTTNPP